MGDLSTEGLRANALVDHYHKTADLISRHWERRSRQFVTLVAVLAGAALVAFARPLIAPALEALALKNLELTGDSLDRLKTLTPVAADLLLAFLVVVVFYLTASLANRSSLIIDAYLYMSLLEREIRGALEIPKDEFAFTREGAFYKIAGTAMTRLVARCYKIVLGSLLVFFFAARLFFDFPHDLPALGPERAIVQEWVAKSFLFAVDVLIVVPTLWLFVRFARLRAISEAEARLRMKEIQG